MMRNCISLISIFTLFMLGSPALNWAQAQGEFNRRRPGGKKPAMIFILRLYFCV